MDLDRHGLEIGPFDFLGITLHPTLHWYGLIIVTGIFVAAAVTAWMARRDDKNPQYVWDGLLWIIFFALIGARVWHVFFPSISAERDTSWYLSHFFDLENGPLAIWTGGMSIFGGALGGGVGVIFCAWRYKQDILSWLDIASTALPIGQAIGRWGNYVNEELYGKPTSLPWGIHIDNPPAKYASDTRFHPLFLYESIWDLLTFGVLLFVWSRYRSRLKKGDIVLMYMILYPVGRFMLEYLRIEVTMSGGLNVSQVFSAAVAIFGAGVLILRHYQELLHWLRRTPAQPAS
jgi:phosphatidylglycerol---prolipoprotein diacylglyceryl transferase